MVIAEERVEGPNPRHRRRAVTVLSWLLVAPFVIWAAARLLGFEGVFPTVQLLAFTPYAAAASLLPLVTAILTKRLWPAVAAAIVALALGACLLPRWLADADAGPAIAGGPAF